MTLPARHPADRRRVCAEVRHRRAREPPESGDDEGLSARIGVDRLGHTHVSMTQDRYMTRGRVHTQAADVLDRAVRINDE